MGEKIAVVIVTYNHSKYIGKCLSSILCCNPDEIIIVDNGSTDGTREIINKFEITTIINNENKGYGQGVNLGVESASSEILFILNPDTFLDPINFNIIKKLFNNNEPLVLAPRILKFNSEINTIGLSNHFTGLSFTNENQFNINGVSGAGFLIKKKDFIDLGGFDESLFLYMEDTELSWKMIKNGYIFKYAPELTIYHDYSLKLSPEKFFHLERGRIYIINSYLSNNEKLKILPSLVLVDLISLFFSILNGWNYFKMFYSVRKNIKIFSKTFNRDTGLFLKLNTSLSVSNEVFSGKYSLIIINYIFKKNIACVSS